MKLDPTKKGDFRMVRSGLNGGCEVDAPGANGTARRKCCALLNSFLGESLHNRIAVAVRVHAVMGEIRFEATLAVVQRRVVVDVTAVSFSGVLLQPRVQVLDALRRTQRGCQGKALAGGMEARATRM
jgi:hypothetical protein